MLGILPNTNYNTNFKQATNHSQDYARLAEQITAIVADECPSQKDVAERVMTKNVIKSFLLKLFPKIKEYKVRRLDKMFKKGKLRVINRKFDTSERLRVLEYEHGAYQKFVYVSDLIKFPHINYDSYKKYKVVKNKLETLYKSDLNIKTISEERFPSGETRYYECVIVAKEGTFDDYFERVRQNLSKCVLPNGTTYTYHYYPNGNKKEIRCSDGTIFNYYPSGKLEAEILPDCSKRTYFENGYIKEVYDTNGKVIKSNLIK